MSIHYITLHRFLKIPNTSLYLQLKENVPVSYRNMSGIFIFSLLQAYHVDKDENCF